MPDSSPDTSDAAHPVKIFLTGAGGYIGLHILRELLEARQQVTALVRTRAKLGPFAGHPGLKIIDMDLAHTDLIAQAIAAHDVCIHAALIWGQPGSELDMRDIAIAAKLFEAAGHAGLTICIYLSSVAVHRPFIGEMQENDCLSTTDFYGATKAAGEFFLRASCARHAMTGITIRPGPVVGPPAFPGGAFGSHNLLPKMVDAAAAGQPIEVPHGDDRQFIDVTMVARLVRLLTTAKTPCPTYICVDRDSIRWEQVARMVVTCLHSSSEIRVPPHDPQESPAYFQPDRFEQLIGQGTNAETALRAHIHYLAQITGLKS